MAPKETQLIVPQFHRFGMIAALMVAAVVPAAEFAAEVYRDESITVRAGLVGSGSHYVYLGDVLVLNIAVSYDPSRVFIPQPDGGLFTSAWPADSGARLLDWHTRHEATTDSPQKHIRSSYRFQILGCPDDVSPTCPGDRQYTMPEFVIEYQDLRANGALASSIRFRPWPETVTVSTTLQIDEEGQLYPFETYFPAGGYPAPLIGKDGTRTSVLIAGIGTALLMGGLVMWPFRSRTQKKAAADIPRWLEQLQLLRNADPNDDARYLDGLRRCLVWYCNDELRLDPFVWLDLAEPADESVDDGSHTELHNPSEQGVELRERLEQVISTAGRAGTA
ncbi:MAG: hypothetical protein ACE5KS_01715 [Woeseiaceae bacterium]